jgi:hypothetical protein
LESGCGVGKLKCDEQPLFRSESPGFVNLIFRELILSLSGTPRTFDAGSGGFHLHEIIVTGNERFVMSSTMSPSLGSLPSAAGSSATMFGLYRSAEFEVSRLATAAFPTTD